MNPLMKAFVKGHVWLYRASGGRRGSTMEGRKVILLTTVGKKSGQPRTVPLVPFIDGSDVYVMASMGGAPSNPAWYGNLLANPDVMVQLGADTWPARAVPLEGKPRDDIWARVKADMPNFGKYEQKTSRVIPVVRLERQKN